MSIVAHVQVHLSVTKGLKCATTSDQVNVFCMLMFKMEDTCTICVLYNVHATHACTCTFIPIVNTI